MSVSEERERGREEYLCVSAEEYVGMGHVAALSMWGSTEFYWTHLDSFFKRLDFQDTLHWLL